MRVSMGSGEDEILRVAVFMVVVLGVVKSTFHTQREKRTEKSSSLREQLL